MTEYITIDELQRRGQVIEHTTKGNIIKPCYCGNCEGHFTCTYDYGIHKSRGNCKPKPIRDRLLPAALDTLPWKPFTKRKGEWIFSNQSTLLLQAITNGNTRFGNYRYWTGENNKFICREKIGSF